MAKKETCDMKLNGENGRAQIFNIPEMLACKHGTSYKGSIAVLWSGEGKTFGLMDEPFYVNAFSYGLVLAGKAVLSVDGTDFPVDANSLCLLSPLHLTAFRPLTDDFRCLFLTVSKSFVDAIASSDVQPHIVRGMRMHAHPVVQVTSDEKLLLRRCIEEVEAQLLRRSHSHYLALIQHALLRFYLETDDIVDRHQSDEYVQKPLTRYTTILRDFVSLLMAHFRREHTVPFYAAALHITPHYLTRIVKEQTGHTVNDFIGEMLYSEARSLLSLSELSVQQIAAGLCFADAPSFTKFFKRRSGKSPLKYREEVAKQERVNSSDN